MTTVTEPFGYFRATPFGWEDCSDSDEGAKALYEITPEQAFEALGWFSRLEIAQDRIVELERQNTILLDACLRSSSPHISTNEQIQICRDAIASVQRKEP